MAKKKVPNSTAELSTLISKDLEIPEIDPANYTRLQLREELIKAINQLLDTDFNKLLNILYRIDVSEEHIKMSLSLPQNSDISPAIADLIIARALEKIETRRKYSGT